MKKFKTLLISFLVAACAVCLSLAFVACSGGGDKSESKYGYGEEGVYYYSANSDTDYLMTLQSGTYMISAGGVSGYSGTYSYDADDGSFVFTSSDGEKFEASFAENAMQLAVAGTPYTFLKKVDYSVKFMDGSSTMDTQSVTYGKAVSAIDGEKSGYIFIGWYEDQSFTTKYTFDSAVTGDITLYAYYIAEDDSIPNYKVKFISDGEVVYETATQNGVVYDMPEVSGILGWWVSDTNDGNELTYKYDGQVLAETTNLYAVKANALGASIYGDKVTWEGSASSVTITVDGTVVTSSAANGAYAYDFDSLFTGRHEIEVSASGYGAENLVYVVNRLARVSNFSVYGTTLVYNRVENAQYYYISVTCANPSHDHSMVYNGNTLTYDFSNCEMGPDGITFTVYAYGTGYSESVSETFVYSLILDGVAVKIDSATDTVSWNAVTNATGYEVYVNGTYAETVIGTEYSLKNYDFDETIIVQVKPVAPGYYSEISAAVSYTKATLRAPEITEITDYYISWTEVKGATGYEVSINGYIIDLYPAAEGENAPTKIYVGNGNSDDEASDYYSYIIDGTNVISVAALADGGKTSQFSDAVYATKLTMSPVLSYKDGVISWTAALAADTYYVEYEGTVTEVAGISFDITFTHSGENTVKVYFDGDSYAEITVYAYAIVFDARGGENVDTIYVVKGDVVELPESSLEGYEFTAWYTLPDLTNFDADATIEYSGDGAAIGTRVTFEASVDQVYYAFYTPLAYSLTIHAESGYLVDSDGIAVTDDEGEAVSELTTTVYFGRVLSLPVAVSTDGAKTFAGWYDVRNHTGNKYVDENGDCLIVWNKSYDSDLYAGYWTVLSFSTTTYGREKVASVSKGSDIDMVKEVTVPEEYEINGTMYPVGYIGSSAFYLCYNIEVINIPDTVQFIQTTGNGYSYGSGAFSQCSALRAVNVYATGDDEDTTKEVAYYSDSNGALYRKESDGGVTLIYFPKALSGEVVIPGTVSNNNEYEYDADLNIVKVYRNVETIAMSVFSSNSKITKITIPCTVKLVEKEAFYSASKLEEVVFEESEGDVASLTIEEDAFQRCTSLTKVTLPSHLTSFDFETFAGCTSLTELDMVKSGAVYSVVDGFLCNSSGSEIVYAPKGITEFKSENSAITAIGPNAFEKCTLLEIVVIGANIRSIGAEAFNGCTGITSLTFNGEKDSGELTIGESAFYGCTKITRVTLPANLVSLGAYAFGGCSKLTTVDVQTMNANPQFADEAFATTTGTYYVTTLTIGDGCGPINIGSVFGSGVETINLSTANTYYAEIDDVIYYSDMSAIAFFPNDKTQYETPDGLTTIGAYVFRGKTKLVSVTISIYVTEIGAGAFSGCTSLSSVVFKTAGDDETAAQSLEIDERAFENCTSLTSIGMPERLIAISDGAFSGCTGLTSFEITKNVIRVGAEEGDLDVSSVFSGCTSLSTISVEDGNTVYSSAAGIIYNVDKTQIFYVSQGVGAEDGTVTIPNSVNKIWSYAFSGNTAMTKLVFDDGDNTQELEMEEYAFANCTKLTDISLPKRLKVLNEGVFSGCTALTSITIPTGIEKMDVYVFGGDTALTEIKFEERDADNPTKLELADGTSSKSVFNSLTSLASISLPEGTTAIPTYAFRSCSSLTSVTIPTTVTEIRSNSMSSLKNLKLTFTENSHLKTIGDYAFSSTTFVSEDSTLDLSVCSELETVGQSAFNSDCGGVDKIIFPESTKELGSYVMSESEFKTVIAEGVEVVGGDAFYESSIESVTFGNLRELGGSAFYRAMSLSEVNITAYSGDDESYTGLTIGDMAFAECTKLKTLVLPYGTVSLGTNCFARSDGDEAAAIETITIPATVKSIGANCFYECESLTTVNFEVDGISQLSSLSSIGESAFASSGIQNFSFPETNEMITLGTNLFRNCTLSYLYLSSTVDNISAVLSNISGATPQIVISENNQSYSSKDGISAIFNAEGTSIEWAYYSGNETTLDLTTNDYAGLTGIGDYAFQACKIFTEIKLPNTITSIGAHAFDSCTKLATINLPEGLISIGDAAFYGCTGLTTVAIPSSLLSLGSQAFYNCSALATVTFGQASVLTTISDSAFYGCKLIVSIELPQTVTSIGASAFYNCTGLAGITLSDNVTSLGNSAFYGCSSITTIDLNNVKIFGTQIFYNCTSLASVTWPSYGITSELADSQYLFRNCGFTVMNTLPETIIALPQSMFYSCTSLTSVVLPSHITSLPGYIFYGCTSLTKVEFKGQNISLAQQAFYNCSSLVEIDMTVIKSMDAASVFYGCSSLVEIDLSNLDELSSSGTSLFRGCTSLTTVVLNDDWTYMPDYMFYGCTSLKELELPSSLERFGGSAEANYTFNNSGLETLVIPEGVTTLWRYTFANCPDLREVTILGDVEAIPRYCFQNSVSLEIINLPLSVTSIDNYAFSGCTSLVSVVLPAYVTTMGDYVFSGCTALEYIIIPEAMVTMGTYTFQNCTALNEVWMGSKVTSIGATSFSGCSSDLVMYVVNTASFVDDNWGSWVSSTGFTGTVYYYYDADDVAYTADGTAYACNYWCIEEGSVVIVEYSPQTFTAENGYVLFNADLDTVVGLYLADGDEETGFVQCEISSCTAEGDGTYTVVVGEDEGIVYTVTLAENGSATITEVDESEPEENTDDTEEGENP